MAKIGRNDPCPCGSGKKYKKCCIDAAPLTAALPPEPHWIIEDDGLDDLSNSVIDLINQRRFDDALAACRRLLEDYPDVVDGFERAAMVFAAMGNHERAADFYRQALDFVTDPVRRDDYEDADFYRQQLEQQERLARPR